MKFVIAKQKINLFAELAGLSGIRIFHKLLVSKEERELLIGLINGARM
ncbi:MAG: hypothetical protein ACXAD7_01590 [Candidatus Kariarchaeaceae archaeon]|jgi:hypothetical protein